MLPLRRLASQPSAVSAGGMLWPAIFDYTIAGLVISQLTIIGLFSIKQGEPHPQTTPHDNRRARQRVRWGCVCPPEPHVNTSAWVV